MAPMRRAASCGSRSCSRLWTATGHRREGRETALAAVGAFGSVTYFLGVDIGGTFTDCVAVNDEGRVFHAKTPSTHSTTPVDGVIEGLELLAGEAGVPTGDMLAEA